MKDTTSKAKWVGILVLHIPLYLVSSYVMRSLLGGSYGLLVKAGANLPPNLLLQHFLVAGILDGFLAGLIGLLTIRAMMLLPIRLHEARGPAWKHPQAWTWTIATCWFAFGIFVWIAANAHPSVLATSSGLRLSDFIAVFFGRGCDLSAQKIDLSVVQTCMNQLSYTHLWLGTIGYAAAAFIPAGWFRRIKNFPYSTKGLGTSTEAHSGPGEVLN